MPKAVPSTPTPAIPPSPIKQTVPDTSRPVVYPEIKVELCRTATDNPFTGEYAKRLLGWMEETKEAPFEEDFLLIDRTRKKIRCSNNVRNRFYTHSNALAIMQEILQKRWKLNLMTIVIGRTGITVNAQHRLIGLVLACQEWAANREKYAHWETEPTIETLLAFGCEETDDVCGTFDTGKPRTLAEAIGCSGVFADLGKGQKKLASRICERAIMTMWDRTAVKKRMTHSEAMAFIEAHPRLLDSVKHILEEDGGKQKQVARWIGPGVASALLYMMGSAKSDPTKYKGDEKSLDWTMWDAAKTFWVDLAGKAKNTVVLRKSLTGLVAEGMANPRSRPAVLAKAWMLQVGGKPTTAESLALKYVVEDDVRRLAECPTVGGIDRGSGSADDKPDPTPAEIELRKAEQKALRGGKKAEAKKAPVATTLAVGVRVWVPEEEGDTHWSGVIDEIYQANGVDVVKIRCANKKVFEEPASRCLTTNPDA